METLTAPNQYREKLSTVDQKGKRLWVYAKKPGGYFFNRRIAVGLVLFALLFGVPFITVGGHPLLLANVFTREFVLVGKPFFPSDFYLFALGLIIFFVFIILFTVVFGRLWCGWACPQTLFMELIFRPIEYAFEGGPSAQKKLDAMPWNAEKLARRGGKYGAFLLFSLLIAHTVMTYLVGPAEAWRLMTHSPAQNPAGFGALVGFTGVFFFVFAYLREQVCTAICPYGRLQGVLVDKDTAQVTYDYRRGEPRGKKGTTHADCVDCTLCVQVCPTGIDIRNGTQLECINCTACMDACDAVMLKLARPTGLIRIDSMAGVAEGRSFRFTRRVAAYTVVLCLLVGLEGFLFYTRKDVDATVLRVPGMLYQTQPNGAISNLYNIQLVNKTFKAMPLRVVCPYPGAQVRVVGGSTAAAPAAKAELVAFIELPGKVARPAKTKLPIRIYAGQTLLAEASTTFFSPGS